LKDAAARQSLRELLRDYHRELVADRGMDMEAQVLEIIREQQQSSYEPGISIKEITQRFAEKHGEDYERKITPHWIGRIVRRKLGLKTEKRHGSYVLGAAEGSKLARLFERYGISEGTGGRTTQQVPQLLFPVRETLQAQVFAVAHEHIEGEKTGSAAAAE
jgi:hypothetical protein